MENFGDNGETGNTLIVANVRLPEGCRVDLHICDGLIVRQNEPERVNIQASGVKIVDGDGCLVLPGLVDGHMHLDKTLFGTPWFPQQAGPSRWSRIETEKRLRADLPPVAQRAANLVESCIAKGTTAIRTHVDIDPDIGLGQLRAVGEVREAYAGKIDIQIVAFPQSGVLRCPGTAELLDAAFDEGADLLGGIDPIGIDEDLNGHLDVLFEIAERHDVGVDIHLHDGGSDGLAEIAAFTERARAHGVSGRMTVSHGFSLAGANDMEFETVAAAMARAGVNLATHGGGASLPPPVKKLRDRGVEVFAGSDNIRDMWSPYGDGDMLERAMLLAWRSGFRNDPDLLMALECAGAAGARALGLTGHGLAPGDRADFFTVTAETPAEAVVSRPGRPLVVKNGHVVAMDGKVI
jgi:cytosine/creatinine deaminase